jgi:hypothetical protein
MRLRTLASVAFLAHAACGGATVGAGDAQGAPQGVACGPSTPDGSCNVVTDVRSLIQPTCGAGTVPSGGVGGDIVDGTYVLTSQTYYGITTCSFAPVSLTMQLSSGCAQLAGHAEGIADGGELAVAVSATVAAQGNQVTLTPTCQSVAGTADAPRTYTATATTLTFFIHNSAFGNPNPDRLEVFARR